MKKLLVSLSAVLLAGIIVTPAVQAKSTFNERLIKRLNQMTARPGLFGHPYRIYIVDGFRDVDVDAFLDAHFETMQNVMFTHVILTDKNGAPKRDNRTGDVLTEDDGC